jgi:uncharacterized MAPEG superfamily protein
VTIPIWMLLGFAAWTLIVLMGTIAVYRWSRILTGRVAMKDFRADRIEGEDWYRRAMRAHANCVENLPVFGAIVFAIYISGVRGAAADDLSIAVLAGRVMQSLTHVSFTETNTTVFMRFLFFSVQMLSFLWLIALVIRQAMVIR